MKAQYKLRSYNTNLKHLDQLENDKIQYTHLLLGDSMLENLLNEFSGLVHYQQLSTKASIFNAGVGGDKIENVMYRMTEGKIVKNKHLTDLQYVYLLIGTNNLNNKNTKCKTAILEGITTIIYLLTKNLPQLRKIYIMNISPRKDIKQELVDDVNESLLNLTRETPKTNNVELQYLNWSEQLLNENRQINDQYYYDHVHLNTDGYQFMCNSISQTIDDQKSN